MKRLHRLEAILLTKFLWFVTIAGASPARAADPPGPQWVFLTRAHLGGTSASSDPAGIKVYSAVGLEIAARRRLEGAFAAECCLALESREVERTDVGGVKTNLGSIESLPLTALLQWRIPVNGTIRPYLGAGANLTVFWEKSGLLDSDDLTPTIGPALQLGADFDLSPAAFLNVDLRWNSSKTDIEEQGTKIGTLRIHPSSFGAGIGFRF